MLHNKFYAGIAAALLAVLLTAAPAIAHSIHIFGWATETDLNSFSYFTRDKPITTGEVTIKSAKGKVLATGQPNEEGIFSIPLSKLGAAKKIVLTIDLGDGHRAEFAMDLPQANQPQQ